MGEILTRQKYDKMDASWLIEQFLVAVVFKRSPNSFIITEMDYKLCGT
jgi:hypothetical protein